MADASIDILLRHQVYLQRFGSHEANQFESYLKDADKIIRDILSRYPDEIPTKAALNDIGRELRARIDPVYSGYTEQLMLDLEGLSGSEADYTVAAIDDDLVADVDSVEHSAVWRQTLARPVTTGVTARFMQAMLSDFTAQEIDRVNQVVVSGFYEGKTTSQIARSIRGTKKNRFTDGILNVTSRNAGVIARTAVNHTATQAKMAVYKKNGRLIKGWVFSATLDSRTSGICRGLHGTEWPTGEGPEPPRHFSCFAGDTSVSTCGGVSNIYKRAYKGRIVEITTKAGRNVVVTPNHPILTDRGWVAAGSIERTDKLIAVNDGVRVFADNEDSIESKFSDLFSAVAVAANPTLIADRPTATKDFHGDVSDSYVSVIDTNGLSWSAVKSILGEKVEDFSLPLRNTDPFGLNGVGSLNFCAERPNATSRSFMGGLGKIVNLLWSAPVHSCLLLLRPVSECSKLLSYKCFDWAVRAVKTEMLRYSFDSDSAIVGSDYSGLIGFGEGDAAISGYSYSGGGENSVDWLVANAEELPDMLDAMVVNGAELDDVLDVVIREGASLHVYNLENRNNWYLANGIIAHNCRSAALPNYDKRLSLMGDVPMNQASVGADGAEVVRAPENYYEWLKTQPLYFQQDVIGKTKTKLLNDGGLTTEEFRKLTITNFGDPLTLDEMRAKDAKAFDKAGV